MKVLVPVKRVVDPYVKIKVKIDGTGVETNQVKMVMNPFDEIALEEAIRLKEKGLVTEIILVSIGQLTSQETLRHGLALGADKAILVETNEPWCSLNIAKILKVIVEKETPTLVLMGKQSIDGDNNQTPQMLAGLLGWSQATNASNLELSGQDCHVVREIDGGLETLKLTLPSVISVDLRLNEPRYASLPNIMKAKQKPLTLMKLDELSVTLTPHRKVISVVPPPVRKGGGKVNSVSELLEKLRIEAKVL